MNSKWPLGNWKVAAEGLKCSNGDSRRVTSQDMLQDDDWFCLTEAFYSGFSVVQVESVTARSEP